MINFTTTKPCQGLPFTDAYPLVCDFLWAKDMAACHLVSKEFHNGIKLAEQKSIAAFKIILEGLKADLISFFVFHEKLESKSYLRNPKNYVKQIAALVCWTVLTIMCAVKFHNKPSSHIANLSGFFLGASGSKIFHSFVAKRKLLIARAEKRLEILNDYLKEYTAWLPAVNMDRISSFDMAKCKNLVLRGSILNKMLNEIA